ncbi:hypothetical protein Clopa_0079 [Clostridium pasteurianum BC1]|uniref:Uncharacterized protein n=1 Tax=Clostridium pasteurianum BC1 TaxID=86416 RepID=R4K3S3_CLOPA|nr:hypothetical protein Clopa_0079 [Clostridium pasteurianum BC1]
MEKENKENLAYFWGLLSGMIFIGTLWIIAKSMGI